MSRTVSANNNDRVTDILEAIVNAVEARQDARAAEIDLKAGGAAVSHPVKHVDTLGGPLTSAELSKLGQVCTEDLRGVDADMLLNLSTMLETHVNSAASVDLIREVHRLMSNGANEKTSILVDEWLRGVGTTAACGPGVLRYLMLRNGLDAANIMLSIMNAHSDRRLLSEDAIESCILLMRHHLNKNVTPTLTGTGHLTVVSPTKSPKNTPKRRRRSSGADQGLIKELKKVYKPIFSSIPQLLVLMETMEKLVSQIPMEDQSLLTLSSSCMGVFSIEPAQSQYQDHCHLFNVASIALLTRISKRYPKHRSILIEDLFPVLLQIPTSKKSQRTFPIPTRAPRRSDSDESGGSVQAMSVLIVSLIQSCVTYPAPYNCEGEPNKKLTTGMEGCQALCDQFVSQLLLRCSKKGEDGGASEFRPVLQNLVDDFLAMQLVPQHAAAEMILITLSRGVGNDVLKASASKKNNAAVESTYLSTAMDCFGKIAACAAEVLSSHRERPLSVSRQVQENTKSSLEGKKVNSCFCGRRSLVDTFMVSCDRCKGFFHGDCVNQTKNNLAGSWLCDDCHLKEMALAETKAFASRRSVLAKNITDDIPPIMEVHVFRQLVLSLLRDETDEFAREYLLATWIKDLNTRKEKEEGIDAAVLSQQFLDLWNTPNANPLAIGNVSPLNKDGCYRLMITLAATTSDLVASFPRQMGLLIQFMADQNIVSIRKLAVKALSQVVDADSKLMLHPALKNAVSDRFADEAKSVREAVVGLVGSFVVSSPELANAFHSSFLPRLQDEGVSVKKRTVKIFRDILVSNPNYKGRAAACAIMLKRAADPKEDDSVRDLIHELFTELWLENSEVPSPVKRLAMMDNITAPVSDTVVATDGTLVTPNSSVTSPVKPRAVVVESNVQIRCRMATEQMIEVVLSAGSRDMLTTLLRNLLSGFSDADKDRKASERKRRVQNASSHCAHLADALIEHLIALEENSGIAKDVFGKKLVATIRTIGAIAQVSPEEVLRHVGTLLPYLKADNGIEASEECETVSEICDILHRMSRVMSQREVTHLAGGSLCDDLMRITYHFGSGALASAVRTLCELGSHPGLSNDNAFRMTAMKLATTFYGYLVKNVGTADDFSKMNKKIQCNIHRALSVLGCLCKSHEVQNDDFECLDENMGVGDYSLAGTLIWNNMIEACYKIFMTFLEKFDSKTKCAALKALTGIFISRPRVLLTVQQAGTITSIMASDSDPELQLQALRSWREILLSEEKRVESGEAEAKMDSNQNITTSSKISGDQDSDATLVGGVLTQHSKRLFAMTKDKDQRIRYACVDLLSHLLRSGLLNPFQTIPFLFGLQGDIEYPEIRALALKLLIAEGEKRPDTLRQRICAGVKNAFLFQCVVYPSRRVTAGIRIMDSDGNPTYESIFGSIFKESIRETKKQKQGLFTNLLGLFEVSDEDDEPNNITKKNVEKTELPLLSFTAEVLAYLPYNTSNDPLFIIYHIQAVAALQGAAHLDKIMKFLQEQGFPIDANDENTEEDDLEIAAKSKHPSKTKEAKPLNSRKFDLLKFEEFCESASSIILLLRLKTYLRKVYNLSETRCIEYTPEGQERNFDKIATAPARLPRFESQIAGIIKRKPVDVDNPNAHDVNKDAIILQYAEFRRLLRLEQTTGSRITEDDDVNDVKEDAMVHHGSEPMEEE